MDVCNLKNIPLPVIEESRIRIKNYIIRTPLVSLDETAQLPDKKIYLKLENLQNTGCFKIRGASSALLSIPDDKLKDGVYTASTGNFGQALAYCCRERNIKCTIFVPFDSSRAKLEKVLRFGGKVVEVSQDEWFEIIYSHRREGMKETFINPVSEQSVIAGNGTIGLEIFEDLPEVEAVVLPYGGGGLTTGVASALKSLNPNIKIYVSESDMAAPVTAALHAGKPTLCEKYHRTFIDGMGGKTVLPEMWCLVSHLVDNTVVVSLKDICKTIKLLAENNNIIAEGAGGASVAAALTGRIKEKVIVCIVSGGNIDIDKIITIFNDEIPEV